MLKDERMAIALSIRSDSASTGPALMVDFGGHTISRRGSRQYVGDEALVIPPYRVVGGPTRCGAPVPVKYVLAVLAVPAPLDVFPEGICACSQLLFLFIRSEERRVGKECRWRCAGWSCR